MFSGLKKALSQGTKSIRKAMHLGPSKAQQADLEDSNVAAIGSDEDRAARKAAAESEPAWEGAGQSPGTQIWRVEKFEIVAWPEEEYGNFFSGDSYIILVTTEDEEGQLHWDIHFWLGASTTQDEMGTAAYKTVELDQIFDDAAIQHREVEGYESEQFVGYFDPAIKVMAGGVDSGFHHVEPESYEPRLLHVKRVGRSTRVQQVPLTASSLNQHDVFVLDAGMTLYQFEGTLASGFEKHKAQEILQNIRSDRNGNPEIGEPLSDDFWEILGGEAEISEEEPPALETPPACLWKLSDNGGDDVEFSKVADAPLSRDMLDSGDVFICDTGIEVFIWVGSDASYAERFQAMPHAMEYLEKEGRPNYLPITRIIEGGETQLFLNAFE